jgi:hypothetical protein
VHAIKINCYISKVIKLSRHTFATRLAQRGVDLYKIAKLLGHEDISTTQRYAHHCSESLRDGVEILDNQATSVLEAATLGVERGKGSEG